MPLVQCLDFAVHRALYCFWHHDDHEVADCHHHRHPDQAHWFWNSLAGYHRYWHWNRIQHLCAYYY